MNKRMLIDAQHREETRVALVNNNQVEDFDCETVGNARLRGNVYLAKVTRVEPSLQACFVEYADGCHGFLAFREIHPDYYNLPQEDRDALMAAALAEKAQADEDGDGLADVPDHDDAVFDSENDRDCENDGDPGGDQDAILPVDGNFADAPGDQQDADTRAGREPNDRNGHAESNASADVDTRVSADNGSGPRLRGGTTFRHYKIQEVIRHRQILLVQVVKEERGNKGAGLTTYLSLAGRYLVLMPNTPRGGGVSRKIVNANDRKRLKGIVENLGVRDGMGLIVRTAGAQRSRSEILRDYGYLEDVWNRIRARTMESVAPVIIHEEGGVVHRAMRDMFDRDTDEVIIHGDTAYREAKDLARMLVPAQSARVKRWTAPVSLFTQEGIEDQLDGFFSPIVQLKSGGYLVIDQTEALVAIDVNSGKSTGERNIEQTAVRTNLEAAEEACRQMRLRDLAGLIVIDFIDMDEGRNNRVVEKKIQACLKHDRARVQNTRISQFGLMEISRQRRRIGVVQANSKKCPVCDGAGQYRSPQSAALRVLRDIEGEIFNNRLSRMNVKVPVDVASYLSNTKQDELTAIEADSGCAITVVSSADIMPGDYHLEIDRQADSGATIPAFKREDFIEGDADDHQFVSAVSDDDPDNPESAASNTDSDRNENTGRKKRRGRRGARRDRELRPVLPPADGSAVLDALATSFTHLFGDKSVALPEPEAVASLVELPGITVKNRHGGNDGHSKNDKARTGKSRRRRRRPARKNEAGDKNNATPSGREGNNTPMPESDSAMERKDAPDSQTATIAVASVKPDT